jgi:hypothetical protein
MIPRRSILGSLEAVCKALTRCDRTLSNAVDAVHVHSLVLSNPVPVNAGAIYCHAVDYSDVKGLLPVSFGTELT